MFSGMTEPFMFAAGVYLIAVVEVYAAYDNRPVHLTCRLLKTSAWNHDRPGTLEDSSAIHCPVVTYPLAHLQSVHRLTGLSLLPVSSKQKTGRDDEFDREARPTGRRSLGFDSHKNQ